MSSSAGRPFKTAEQLERWLEANHDTQTELWVRLFKKASGTPSVDWKDCVRAALIWGWIDGQRKSLDEVSFLQRLTPRRAKSTWSKKNCELAEQLIAEGHMQPSGVKHVVAAKQDGRWEQAYAGPANMVIPDDFLRALSKNAAAKRFYATLNRQNLYAIYHRIQTAKRAETRQRRITAVVTRLASGKAFY